jgi:hypothetical protein
MWRDKRVFIRELSLLHAHKHHGSRHLDPSKVTFTAILDLAHIRLVKWLQVLSVHDGVQAGWTELNGAESHNLSYFINIFWRRPLIVEASFLICIGPSPTLIQTLAQWFQYLVALESQITTIFPKIYFNQGNPGTLVIFTQESPLSNNINMGSFKCNGPVSQWPFIAYLAPTGCLISIASVHHLYLLLHPGAR